jgi:hypothetical protein
MGGVAEVKGGVEKPAGASVGAIWATSATAAALNIARKIRFIVNEDSIDARNIPAVPVRQTMVLRRMSIAEQFVKAADFHANPAIPPGDQPCSRCDTKT